MVLALSTSLLLACESSRSLVASASRRALISSMSPIESVDSLWDFKLAVSAPSRYSD